MKRRHEIVTLFLVYVLAPAEKGARNNCGVSMDMFYFLRSLGSH